MRNKNKFPYFYNQAKIKIWLAKVKYVITPIVIIFIIGVFVSLGKISALNLDDFQVLRYKLLPEANTESALREKAQLWLELGRDGRLGLAYDLSRDPKTVSDADRENYIKKNKKNNDSISLQLQLRQATIDQTIVENNSSFGFVKFKYDKSSFFTKWKYNNSHWYYTVEQTFCSRLKPYPKPPEFERALSLVLQRQLNYEGSLVDLSSLNCLDIQYSDLSTVGAEGVFHFAESFSSPERLLIQVDHSYRNYDDLLTASLLAHELTHMTQFIDEYYNGKSITCFEAEEKAFRDQISFLTKLNEEERSSLINRVTTNETQGTPLNSSLQQIRHLYDLMVDANVRCGDGSEILGCLDANIEEMVRSSPYYQEQCRAN